MRKKVIFILLLTCLLRTPSGGNTLAIAQYQTTSYDKEQLKKDYRAFLQQLKELNKQYKEITGEMGQVMKEEGIPTWDMGEGVKLADTQKTTTETVNDLGGGAYIKETAKDMILTLDLPGYKKDSIKLKFKDGKTLSILAERKIDTLTKSFDRSFDLPAPGDQKASQAAYQDGVLTVKIPKIASQEVSIPIR
jgi:HSP20 family molecular chaperone IbpA